MLPFKNHCWGTPSLASKAEKPKIVWMGRETYTMKIGKLIELLQTELLLLVLLQQFGFKSILVSTHFPKLEILRFSCFFFFFLCLVLFCFSWRSEMAPKEIPTDVKLKMARALSFTPQSSPLAGKSCLGSQRSQLTFYASL